MKKVIVYFMSFMLFIQAFASPSKAISNDKIPLKFNITQKVGAPGTYVEDGNIKYTNFDKGVFEIFNSFNRLYSKDLYKLDNIDKTPKPDLVSEFGFDPYYELGKTTNPDSWNDLLVRPQYPETYIKEVSMTKYIRDLKAFLIDLYKYETLHSFGQAIDEFSGYQNFLDNQIGGYGTTSIVDISPQFVLMKYKDIYYDKNIQSRSHEIKNITKEDFIKYRTEFNRIKSKVPEIKQNLVKAKSILTWNLSLTPAEATKYYTHPFVLSIPNFVIQSNGQNTFGFWEHDFQPETFNYMVTLSRVYLEEIIDIESLLDKIERMEIKDYIPSPLNLNIENSSYNSLRIGWIPESGVSGYEIYRSTSSAGPYSLIQTTTSTSFLDVKLTTQKKYYYKIRAYKMLGKVKDYGEFSNVITGIPLLSTPTNLMASKSSSKNIKLTWKSVEGANGYEIYRKTLGTGQYALLKNTNLVSYTDSSLKAGKTYYYKIRAYRKIGKTTLYSGWTKEVLILSF